ncbi:hypothetical protein C3489_08075 [Streptomyces sp. Ru71]|nr:hypothetical protein C3489_08075 [Streptomyces sp. Ru71]
MAAVGGRGRLLGGRVVRGGGVLLRGGFGDGAGGLVGGVGGGQEQRRRAEREAAEREARRPVCTDCGQKFTDERWEAIGYTRDRSTRQSHPHPAFCAAACSSASRRRRSCSGRSRSSASACACAATARSWQSSHRRLTLPLPHLTGQAAATGHAGKPQAAKPEATTCREELSQCNGGNLSRPR